MVNYSYFATHERINPVKRSKRRRANEYDPKADKSDLAYQNNYGL